ncbi:MAG: tyrosine-type recombinase/integrase [Chloroflexia bacterium]
MSTEIIPAAPPASSVDPELLAGQLAESSIRKYRQDWRAYQEWCEGKGLGPVDATSLSAYRAALANDTALSPNTINRQIAAVKRIVREAAAQGLISAEAALAVAVVRGVNPSALRDRLKPSARQTILPADLRRLCDSPDVRTLLGLRDRALLHTLASSAVRIAELCALQLGHITLRDGGYSLRVLSKSQTAPRDAHLTHEAYEAIIAWISARPFVKGCRRCTAPYLS